MDASQSNDASPQRLGGPKPAQKPSKVDQDIEAIERQEKIEKLRTREDYIEQYDPPKKKRKFLRFLGWMFLIVLLTGAGAGAGWYYWLRKEPKPAPAVSQQTEQTPPPAVAEEAPPTSTHTSATFNLQFDYPQTWKANEGSDNKITATSPAMKLKTTSGGTQTGQVIMTVQHKQISLPEFKNGNATAILESEKIDYTKPSQVQRASTYLSFLNYADSTAKGIDGIYITGDNGYQKDQAIPLVDIAKADPLITITFRKCADDKCATPGEATAIAASAWDDTTFAKPIKTMLQSIIAQ